MRIVKKLAFLCLVPAMFAQAQEVAPNCSLDLDNLSESSAGMPNWVITNSSERARTLIDFRNAAVNFFFYDPTGNAARQLLVGTISPGFGFNSLPMCNEVGQCVTVRIIPTFSGSISIGGFISIGSDLFHTGYQISAEDEGGNRQSYETGMEQNSLAIPATGPAGLVYQDMTCRQNNHLEQDTDGSEGSGSGSSGTGSDGGGFGPDPNGGQEGYPGAVPVTGGGGSGNCWEFTARDQDGNYIGSYIICY